MQPLKFIIRDGIIYDTNNRMIAVLTDEATDKDERLITLGSEAVPAVEEFIKNVNSGNYKPRAAVKKFETLIQKYS